MKAIVLGERKLDQIKGILFDKDGTLINSEQRLLATANLRINEAKIFFESENKSKKLISKLEKLLSKAYGVSSNSVSPNGSIAIASNKDNLLTTATVFCIFGKGWHESLKIANYIFEAANKQLIKSNTNLGDLLPGVKELLNRCSNNSIKTGIISNDSRAGIQQFIHQNKIEDHFPFFWSAEDHPAKPNPDSVLGLCRLMNLKASECILIGDSDTDMSMAQESGIALALGYNGGWETPPKLYEHHHIINHWNELTFE